MADRLASVHDLAAQRARRGAQVGRGAARRVNPGVRPVRKGRRRAGESRKNPKPAMSRAARRLAWKVERRETAGPKVRWSESKAKAGGLAPVVPLRHRGEAGRLLVPDGQATAGGDLMGGAA